jgi:hypothetical protein
MNTIRQVGHTNGDKGIKSIPNLKFGEFRYYTQDNANIDRMSVRQISPKVFIRIMTCLFPKYHIEFDDEIDGKKNIWSVGNTDQGFYCPLLINKGYVCIKEASSTEEGTVFCLHDGVVLAYKETYKG